ncbi:hypothetical protein [Subtercola boreus]|nr:hypothetical protein [Subtercola boreus]
MSDSTLETPMVCAERTPDGGGLVWVLSRALRLHEVILFLFPIQNQAH